MKKALCLCLIGYCFLTACHKNSNPAPVGKQKALQIVVSNVTTTLTIFSFSVTRASSSDTLINIYSQTGNNAYAVNVNSGSGAGAGAGACASPAVGSSAPSARAASDFLEHIVVAIDSSC